MSQTYPVPYTPPDEVIGSGSDSEGGVADPGANGYIARTAYGVSAARTLQGGPGISISNADGVVGDSTIGLAYQVYTALLTQSGTDAPVATVLENTIGAIVWARGATGVYTATLSNAFPVSKRFVLITANIIGADGVFVGYNFSGTSVMTLRTLDSGSAPADDLLAGTSIEIRVYP